MVTSIIDGDTFIINDKYPVRMIGINAPEKGMYFYEEAKQNLEILILGKYVILETDVSNKDKYGRLLRYVFENEYFINYEMVKFGFANAYDYEPDTKYSKLFKEAEEYARANNSGVWEKKDLSFLEVKINYDADGKDEENLNDEWVQLMNKGDEVISFKNWSIKDSATNIYIFKDFKLYPDDSVFLFTGYGVDSSGKIYWNSSRPIWNNNHDTLYLRDSSGILVEYLNYWKYTNLGKFSLDSRYF